LLSAEDRVEELPESRSTCPRQDEASNDFDEKSVYHFTPFIIDGHRSLKKISNLLKASNSDQFGYNLTGHQNCWHRQSWLGLSNEVASAVVIDGIDTWPGVPTEFLFTGGRFSFQKESLLFCSIACRDKYIRMS
jgi:hypothetical protein